MNHRALLVPAAAGLVLAQLSCAVAGLTPLPQSMPAARAALDPQYRLFYDSLVDYGDWVLIEPFGHVFRPRVTVDSWRPYGDGFWVPTDLYGWVWVSAEPFGWATYHYGTWFYDPYQRWVWVPGLDWAPAWVVWDANDTYVGWSPLMPRRGSPAAVPGGAFSYVPAERLAATDLKSHIVSAAALGERLAGAQRIENPAEAGGVRFNRGPRIEWVERATGPLKRAKIEDVVAAPAGRAAPAAPAPLPPGETRDEPLPLVEPAQAKRAGETVAREARVLTQRGAAAPGLLRVVRPFGPPAEAKPAPREAAGKPRAAEPDSVP